MPANRIASESRMREIRPSGSMRGRGALWVNPLYSTSHETLISEPKKTPDFPFRVLRVFRG